MTETKISIDLKNYDEFSFNKHFAIEIINFLIES